MAANVSGAGGVDEPSADFSRGEIAEVTQNAGNSRRKPASNFSIQDKRQARSRVSGRGEQPVRLRAQEILVQSFSLRSCGQLALSAAHPERQGSYLFGVECGL